MTRSQIRALQENVVSQNSHVPDHSVTHSLRDPQSSQDVSDQLHSLLRDLAQEESDYEPCNSHRVTSQKHHRGAKVGGIPSNPRGAGFFIGSNTESSETFESVEHKQLQTWRSQFREEVLQDESRFSLLTLNVNGKLLDSVGSSAFQHNWSRDRHDIVVITESRHKGETTPAPGYTTFYGPGPEHSSVGGVVLHIRNEYSAHFRQVECGAWNFVCLIGPAHLFGFPDKEREVLVVGGVYPPTHQR